MTFDVPISACVVIGIGGVTGAVRHFERNIRESRALSTYERCRRPDSDAARDISRIIESFHSNKRSERKK